MIPFFSSSFWALTDCDLHICIWKLSKFIFMEPPPFAHSGLQNTWVLEVKVVRSDFVVFNSGNINIKESKKPSFNFFFDLRTKFVWSHGLITFCNVLYKNKFGRVLFCFIFLSRLFFHWHWWFTGQKGNWRESLFLSMTFTFSEIFRH